MTTLPFHCGQTFYIDRNAVANADQVAVSSINLYFHSKPAQVLNTSGVENPGVSIYIVETSLSVPNLDTLVAGQYARLEYQDIVATTDGSLPSKFLFERPVVIKTNKEYAFLVTFDLRSPYVLWTSKQGDYLVGTNTVSPGPSSRYTGSYYEYNEGDITSTTNGYNANWKPLVDVDLKYDVAVARYAHNGIPVVANTTIPFDVTVRKYRSTGTDVGITNSSILIPTARMEFIIFDQGLSIKESFVGGQKAYQNTFAYPGGYYGGRTEVRVATVEGNDTVTAQTTFTNGSAFNWSTIFPATTTSDNNWIVFKDTSKVNVRQVKSIISNTVIQVDEPLTFSNSSAKFLITPVGQINGFNKSSPFGVTDSIIMLDTSSANSTVKFVNNTIESIAITNGGSGYNNADILCINGWETVTGKVGGGYRAQANIVTNGSGTITGVYFSNSGAGFVNSSLIVATIKNSSSTNTTSNTANGTGATFSYTVGATLKTDLRANNNFRNIQVVNIPISDIIPFFDIIVPPGCSYDMKMQTHYQRVSDANTYSGFAYYVDTEASNNIFTLTMFQRNTFDYGKVPVYMSRSNEFVTYYSNGSLNDTSNNLTGSMMLIVNAVSNNDYSSINFDNYPQAMFSKYLINNDYTNEHTDSGNAWAKHITTKIEFQRESEDLRVYLTAYKPSNTNIKVYARLHNSLDIEAFDDKQWTLLELKDGVGLVSSRSNRGDFIELAYGLPQYGNVQFTCNGSITATNASSNLVGSGTTFSSNLASGDMVRVYSKLFPADHMISVVNTVVNNTLITLVDPVTNNALLGTSLKIDKIQYKYQGFNNIMNDNVARYYNTSLMCFDGFDTMQLKIVLMSDTPNLIPRVDDVRALGVSA